MKNERLQLWISRISGTPAGPGEDATTGEPVDDVSDSDSLSSLQRLQDKVMTTRALGIVALVVFAPVVMIVVFKVLRDIRSSLR
jgi:tetrahydromethanopterin S-methyltransferase subunit F